MTEVWALTDDQHRFHGVYSSQKSAEKHNPGLTFFAYQGINERVYRTYDDVEWYLKAVPVKD